MWKEFEEDYTDPNGGETYAHTVGIKKTDGFELLSHRMNKEGFQTFVCRGAFEEFQFYARRWQGKPLDTYTVWVDGNPDTLRMDKAAHRKLVLSQAKNIASGLLVFPYQRAFDTPVKNVVFDISTNPKVSVLVTVEEI